MQVFAIASNALLVQGRKLEEIAAAVASTGAKPEPARTDGPTQVRIGALPVGDAVEPMVSLKEVELAYKMNAAVIATADEMFDALLDAIHPKDR
jgi:flagellar basal-body rod protein FlgC